ncbi:sensor histidine kinase [Conexibacter woesei]|uniref:histidine kinase n=1 Tax=Conexibacter woesei (strain DSM 14684 / CCUG 47730 / CIP 108061 / JCM 11494 / NBRC 100937 / ID131577) TaxID=469383 RepID=D3FB74_CONWI|nr:sensor histidine kinase [Conexibacter woesei]ADB53266.1 integral membrane sensor signal transduction histidine kinase [Conexibacter woesei DSM 14684]
MAVTARRAALPAWAFDLLLAVAAFVFAVVVSAAVADVGAGERSLDGLAYALMAVGAALLLLRRRWPLGVLAATVAVDAVYISRVYPGGPGPCVSALVALITVAAWRPTRTALLAGGAALAAELFAVLAIAGEGVTSEAVVRQFVWITVGLLAGAMLRAQRASVEAIGARAREAERTRAEEARRQLGEERLRIARELHDVLAHSLAMIHVQASTGAHVVARRPEQAEQVLSAIKQASGEALADLRTTVGVLRADAADGDRGEHEPTGPQPSLARVEELIDGARRAGAEVSIDVSGERRRLPAPVDVAGYRIVQEALTNVVRHAAASSVRVALAYEPDGVALTIDDDGRGAATANGDGHGLSGMRERAALLGGSVEAGPRPGGGFRVRARLPLGAV